MRAAAPPPPPPPPPQPQPTPQPTPSPSLSPGEGGGGGRPLLPRADITSIYAVSDLHADPAYPANWAWVKGLDAATYASSALIVAGDVAEASPRLLAVLDALAEAFAHIVFLPGNHCLWLRGAGTGGARLGDEEEGEEGGGEGAAAAPSDSVAKWRALEAAVASALPGRVHTAPVALGGVVVAPLLSWYEGGWNGEPSPPGAPPAPSIFTDFRACRWPADLAPGAGVSPALAEWWDAQNDTPARAGALAAAWEEAAAQRAPPPGRPRPALITASHFLPFPACLPERRFLFQPALADAAGSRALGARVAALRPDAHVFGHTHIALDLDVMPPLVPAGSGGGGGGQGDSGVAPIRCVHWPLRYPAERARAAAGGGSPRLAGRPADGSAPALLWDCVAGTPGPRMATHWSSYYRHHARTPADVTPAPWVVERAGWARKQVQQLQE